jgi:hypothetical protein
MHFLPKYNDTGERTMSYITYKVKVEYDGTKKWYLNGKRHREDGPAVEYPSGTKEWHLNGQRHREDGPAIEHSDGHKAWFLNGKCLTEEQFNERMAPTVEMTVAEIEELVGKKVKVVK